MDWQFDPAEFAQYDAIYGPFSVDACASSDGSNAQVPKFYHSQNSFLKANVEGENVWLNVPFAVQVCFCDTTWSARNGRQLRHLASSSYPSGRIGPGGRSPKDSVYCTLTLLGQTSSLPHQSSRVVPE
jgi:hypothetical protein